MDNNKIGKFIASLRKEKGLTQQELADKLFLTDKAVSKWERGLSFPDITLIEKLAIELDVDVSEILCGEHGKKKKINVQEEIDKAIAIIEENQIQKKREMKKKIKNMSIISLSVLTIFFITFLIRYNYYHPSIIKEGNNNYEIGFFGLYNLERNGLDEFIAIMEKTEKQNKLNSNINMLNIELSRKGNIKKISLSINYFDNKYNYVGRGNYSYKDRNLNYTYEGVDECKTVSDCEVNRKLVNDYAKSLNIKYLSDKFKKIPFKEQIKLSNLKFYEVSMYSNQKFSESTSVFDMRDNKEIKALTLTDYKDGKGGIIENGIYLVITLNDGSSTIADETYKYIIDNVDGDVKKTDYTMETDYYINGKSQLLFTRDYGNNWIETDLSPDEVKETLNFYRDISLQNSSWFISTNDLIPIAYFYGEKPKLKISIDNGATWNEKTFDIMDSDTYKNITHRIVGFTNQNFGYVALGTDWTMGSGEIKKAFLTTNSGKDWESIDLPENCTSKTLIDFIMYDENSGIVLLSNNQESEFPYMYMTTNKGQDWEKVEYAHKVVKEMVYISNIDSLEKKDNQYIMILSQGDSSTKKIKLKSTDLKNWIYDSTFTSNIHTVG